MCHTPLELQLENICVYRAQFDSGYIYAAEFFLVKISNVCMYILAKSVVKYGYNKSIDLDLIHLYSYLFEHYTYFLR